MESVVRQSNKRSEKRLSAHSIASLFYCILAVVVAVFFFFTAKSALSSDYQVEYVPYVMEQGDTLYGVIQETNKDYPDRLNVLDLVAMAVKENELNDSLVYAGKAYKIPKLIY